MTVCGWDVFRCRINTLTVIRVRNDMWKQEIKFFNIYITNTLQKVM